MYTTDFIYFYRHQLHEADVVVKPVLTKPKEFVSERYPTTYA